MRLKIPLFLKNFGLKQSSELQQPRLHAIKKLDLPLETVYHFLEDNTAVLGPSQADPVFAKLKGKVFIEQKVELDSLVGNPRRTSVLPQTLENDFRRNHRFFKPLRKDAAVKLNIANVAIFNYSMLNPLYKYTSSYKANYYRWLNITDTFWEGVAESCKRFPDWNQFIELHVPEYMPTMSQFKQLTRNTTQDLLENFRSFAALNVFDLYRFFGSERETSYLSKIPKASYDKINFLIRVQGNFFVMNLGKLEEWRQQPDNEVEEEKPSLEAFGEGADVGTYIDEFGMEAFFTPDSMQRKLISLFTTLTEFAHGNDTLIETEVDMSTIELEQPEDNDDITTPAGEIDPEEVDDVKANQKEEILSDTTEEDSGQAKPPSRIVRTFDLDLMEVTYQPPPESDLDETTLIIEKDNAGLVDETKALKIAESKVAKRVVEKFSVGDQYADTVAGKAHELFNAGIISDRTFEQTVDDAMRYHTMPDPFGSGLTIKEAMEIHPEDLEVPKTSYKDTSTIIDKSMLSSKHQAMMRKFNKVLLPKFILQSIIGIQAGGVSVIDVKVREDEDINNHTLSFNVTVKPIRGRASQLHFRIPVIDKDGRFKANGVISRQRQQRTDIPYRKVSPLKVALTSYINKTFVMRSERADNDYDLWLSRQITSRATDATNDTVTNPKFSELDQSAYHLPRVYTSLGKTFAGFDNGKNHFYFDYSKRKDYFQTKFSLSVEDYEKPGYVMTGVREGEPILVDDAGTFYLLESATRELEPMGTIVELLGLNLSKAPIEAINISVSNKELPVGLVLAYHKGLGALIDSLGVEYIAHQRGTKIVVSPDEFTLAFADQILVFPRSNYKAQLVLGGLKRYHQSLRTFTRHDFDSKDVYYRILESVGLSARYLRIVDSLFATWVDPITLKILQELKLPETFEDLVYKAIEDLQTDWSPGEVDGAYMRYRGYERMAGTIHSSLSAAVRRFNSREGSSDQQIVLDQHEVWRRITQDPTVAQVEDSNPIANIREQEAMTYRGDGGRGTVSMVARTRIYGEADVGVLSESTVDSGAVGVIAYLSPDANIDSMFGTTRKFNKETDGPGTMLSTSSLLAVASTNDDAKRVNFISIQQQQGMYADGYRVNPLRTGYEQIVAQRNSSIFATSADQDGEVVEVGKHGITVKYADGTYESAPLGVNHGTAAGVNYPHDLVTSLKKGDKVKLGDTISYNRKYFSEDRYTPNQVCWMSGTLPLVMFSDNLDTLEDGSTISAALAKDLNTQTTEIKNITVRFDQTVRDLVKVGDHLDLDSTLCYIEDPETAENTLFDEASIETLKLLGRAAPSAKMVGTVSKVDVLYHGDMEDMSDNLREIAEKADKIREEVAKELGRPVFTGEVDSSFRIKGQVMEPDTLVIRIYIDHDIPFGVGDKAVMGNQMKTVVSRVMTGRNELEDGTPIDLIFGNTSVEERMVMSPKISAPTILLLSILSKRVAGVYRGKVNGKAK
ncbi:putative RNA polymerase subunit beta [Pseudomonas phage Phabio]|uniref:Putative RNA polymerase subunit beta n=1 Tax=Pseudomonas phage Phabio TaxID=2006668 RepID=A0A1Y0SWD7_9CAUD|nr:RNA polymerase beta subunit [Pseudomonas phage Phabio]ARV76894.1 putative RNA polymerase subunit beta [Pseudomonas phage Phabio]